MPIAFPVFMLKANVKMPKPSAGLCLLLGLFLLAVCGCKQQARLQVYADPWLGTFAEQAIFAFEETHPEIKVDLRMLSSEVIAQRLHFGEPMDLALFLDQSLLKEKQLEKEILESYNLAKTRLVLARRKGDLNGKVPGAGGTAMPASDRPLRRMADSWVRKVPNLLKEQPVRYANFYGQSRDYLLRGWVREGFVLEQLVLQYPKVLEVKEAGPEIPGGVQLLVLKNARNLVWAQKLAKFFNSEKTRELLAACHFIP